MVKIFINKVFLKKDIPVIPSPIIIGVFGIDLITLGFESITASFWKNFNQIQSMNKKFNTSNLLLSKYLMKFPQV